MLFEKIMYLYECMYFNQIKFNINNTLNFCNILMSFHHVQINNNHNDVVVNDS